MYLKKAFVDDPGGSRDRFREVDGFPVPLRDFGFVATMRAGLLAEITDILLARQAMPADAPAPVGILRSLADCRSYGLVRLTEGKAPSLTTLAGYVPAGDEAPRGAVQALRMPVTRDERWCDDTSLCGFDLRRIRDRLTGAVTPACLPAWPKAWIPGYGPKEGFRETLSRGCAVRLSALVRLLGEEAGPWRKLAFPPMDIPRDLMVSPPRMQSFSALRLDRGDGRGDTLRFFTGRRGMETWVSAEGVPLSMQFDLVRRMDDACATKGHYNFVLP